MISGVRPRHKHYLRLRLTTDGRSILTDWDYKVSTFCVAFMRVGLFASHSSLPASVTAGFFNINSTCSQGNSHRSKSFVYRRSWLDFGVYGGIDYGYRLFHYRWQHSHEQWQKKMSSIGVHGLFRFDTRVDFDVKKVFSAQIRAWRKRKENVSSPCVHTHNFRCVYTSQLPQSKYILDVSKIHLLQLGSVTSLCVYINFPS